MPNSLINLAITQFGQVMLLVAIAALLHRLLADRAPRLMLMVWTVVAVKAVTPPVVASRWSLFSWAQAPAFAGVEPNATLPTVPWIESTGWLSGTLGMLAIVWAVGVVASAAVALCRWRHLIGMLCRDRLPKNDPLVDYCAGLAHSYGLRPPAYVVVSSAELGPAVAGVLRPTLILPASFAENRDPATLRPVVLHELVHLTRGDAAIALLYTAVRIVWWFNPAVWWAIRQAESLVERCVDLTVTSETQTSVLEYGRGLLRVLELRAQLQPHTDLASLRPCQITKDRLKFLRVACKAFNGRRDRIGPWARRIGFVALAFALLPALPNDALSPRCVSATQSFAVEQAVDADPVPPNRLG